MRFRVDTSRARWLAARLQAAAAGLLFPLHRELDALGRDVERIFAAHAPVKSGRLRRGVVSTRAGRMVVVRATARNPQTGYDYVGVTRFGHRKAWIYPRQARALRFVIGGRVIYAKRVRGYKPATDWRDEAMPAVRAAADAAAVRLGRRVEAIL